MLMALNYVGQPTSGVKAKPEYGPYACPDCNEAVTHRRYTDRVWHFAHKSESTCGYESGETETHRQCKISLYKALKAAGYECYMEQRVYRRQPDVFAFIGETNVAIEIQNSSIPVPEVSEKIAYYTANDIATLYLMPHNIPGDGSTLTPEAWQRYLHAMYQGNLYYWFDGDKVAIVHLGNYKNNNTVIKNDSFYMQARPVSRTTRYFSIANFVTLRRHESDMHWRHVGMTDALLWQHQLGEWWS